ncbi:MAG: excisionase family DNA-binding protein [Phycisphaerae bacterium]|nr:excisionase family DNA-binding protein [Phycisphaerae bacterium]NUQ45755.1 excisionase family DNA-binding protein [Phycisphaerae bacterium]
MSQRDYLSPRQLAAALGVSESSLKRWVDKGLIQVTRTAGGHRRISRAAVYQFLRTTKTPIANPEFLAGVIPALTAKFEPAQSVPALVDAVCQGDRQTTAAVLSRYYLDGHTMAELFDRLIRPVMQEVGHGWQTNRIAVYQEHRATSVMLHAATELRRMVPPPAPGAPVAVGGAPPADPYLLPTMSADLVLTELGWNAVNLGALTPWNELVEASRSLGAALVWVSLTSSANLGETLSELRQLAQHCERHRITLALGGQALPSPLDASIPCAVAGHDAADILRVAMPQSRTANSGRFGRFDQDES